MYTNNIYDIHVYVQLAVTLRNNEDEEGRIKKTNADVLMNEFLYLFFIFVYYFKSKVREKKIHSKNCSAYFCPQLQVRFN